MKKLRSLFYMTFFLAKASWAVDPISPESLCDRFIAPLEQKNCENKISKINPNWYLAGICRNQFDNTLFFQCLELSNKFQFDPVELDQCSPLKLQDAERIFCLNKIGKQSKTPIYQRIPSSFEKKPSKKNQKN